MDDDLVAGCCAVEHFGVRRVLMANVNGMRHRAVSAHGEHCPLVAAPEQRTHRNFQDLCVLPDDHADFERESITQALPQGNCATRLA